MPDQAGAGTDPAADEQRCWKAAIDLRYAHRDGRTVLAHREHSGPLVVQKPLYQEGPEVCQTILVHPPGGIAGGDGLEIRLDLDSRTHVLVTTPGATKWYRSAGRPASQIARARLSGRATLEWLPQESILFNGADASLGMDVELASGAVFVGWEILCFGRAARGERFDHGRVQQLSRVQLDGRLVWHERGDIAGGGRLLESPVGLAGCTVVGMLLVAGATVPLEVCDRARAAGQQRAPGDRVGMSVVGSVTVARYLGDSSERGRDALSAVWSALRPTVVGRPAMMPRIWST